MKTKVTFNGDNTQVEFPDEEVTVDLAVTRVGKGLYRLDNVPFFVEAAGFGDVIEADRLVNGMLRFRRVVEKSKWKVYDYINHVTRGDRKSGCQKSDGARHGSRRPLGECFRRMFSDLLTS